jgi:hypothetical protein
MEIIEGFEVELRIDAARGVVVEWGDAGRLDTYVDRVLTTRSEAEAMRVVMALLVQGAVIGSGVVVEWLSS